ncbi:g3741 [Coccomyxa elongata]
MEGLARLCGRLLRAGNSQARLDIGIWRHSQQLSSLTTFARDMELWQGMYSLASKSVFSTGSQRHGNGESAAQYPAAMVKLSDAAIKRLRHVLDTAATKDETALRLTVEAGGCSGFSYKFDLGPGPTEDDYVVDCNGQRLVIDSVSHEFVKGATVDFADELIKSTFEVVDNPNAGSKCGCGSSFTPKDM